MVGSDVEHSTSEAFVDYLLLGIKCHCGRYSRMRTKQDPHTCARSWGPAVPKGDPLHMYSSEKRSVPFSSARSQRFCRCAASTYSFWSCRRMMFSACRPPLGAGSEYCAGRAHGIRVSHSTSGTGRGRERGCTMHDCSARDHMPWCRGGWSFLCAASGTESGRWRQRWPQS